MLLKYSKRFYHLGVSILKMSLYRDLAKDDPLSVGYVAFPSGLEDEYFQELTAERRMPVKRGGTMVYRWIKADRQDNEALDTLIQATGAALKFGIYGMSDVSWAALEADREAVQPKVQGDLEDLMGAPGVGIALPEPTPKSQPLWRKLAS
jgi:phage terminase large subunit GpA-like protein